MPINYISAIRNVASRPRSKRLREQGIGSNSGQLIVESTVDLSSKLDKAVFYDLFEKVEISEGIYAIKAKYGLFTDSFLSALGLPPTNLGDDGNPSVTNYSRLDDWDDYADDKSGWVLSAALGHDLYSRIKKLSEDMAVGDFVTLDTAQTVTGAKTFSKRVTAAAFAKSGGTATEILLADGSVANKSILHAVGDLAWSTLADGDNRIVTISQLAYWTGAYKGTYSNLQYCQLGKFGTMATMDAADFVKRSGDTVLGPLTVNDKFTVLGTSSFGKSITVTGHITAQGYTITGSKIVAGHNPGDGAGGFYMYDSSGTLKRLARLDSSDVLRIGEDTRANPTVIDGAQISMRDSAGKNMLVLSSDEARFSVTASFPSVSASHIYAGSQTSGGGLYLWHSGDYRYAMRVDSMSCLKIGEHLAEAGCRTAIYGTSVEIRRAYGTDSTPMLTMDANGTHVHGPLHVDGMAVMASAMEVQGYMSAKVGLIIGENATPGSAVLTVNGHAWVRDNASLMAYSAVPPGGTYGAETLCLQSSFGNSDPRSSSYPVSYPARAVMALQPRGGRVAIGKYSADYLLDVSGDARLEGKLRIGDAVLMWDAANNAVKFIRADGMAADIYITGGVSTLGVGQPGNPGPLTVTSLNLKRGAVSFVAFLDGGGDELFIGNTDNSSYVSFVEDVQGGRYDPENGDCSGEWSITRAGAASFSSVRSNGELTLQGAKFSVSGTEIYVTISNTRYRLSKVSA